MSIGVPDGAGLAGNPHSGEDGLQSPVSDYCVPKQTKRKASSCRSLQLDRGHLLDSAGWLCSSLLAVRCTALSMMGKADFGWEGGWEHE